VLRKSSKEGCKLLWGFFGMVANRLHGISFPWERFLLHEQSAFFCCQVLGGSHTTKWQAKKSSDKVKRKSIAEIRSRMLEKGALLFKFKQPKEGSLDETHRTWFKQMQELGFLVSTSGCIFPYENFSSSSSSNKGRPRAHKVSFLFFKGAVPSAGTKRHQHGWPTAMQVSHLCHRKQCINPKHLVCEEQWKHLKRNYCGEEGRCNCGMKPKCVQTYHGEDWDYQDEWLRYDTEDYKAKVGALLSGLRYVILPRDHYASVDTRLKKRLDQERKRTSSSVVSEEEELFGEQSSSLSSPTPPPPLKKKKRWWVEKNGIYEISKEALL